MQVYTGKTLAIALINIFLGTVWIRCTCAANIIIHYDIDFDQSVTASRMSLTIHVLHLTSKMMNK